MSVSSSLIRFCTYSSKMDLLNGPKIEMEPGKVFEYRNLPIISGDSYNISYGFLQCIDNTLTNNDIHYNDIVHFTKDHLLWIRGNFYKLHKDDDDNLYHYKLTLSKTESQKHPMLALFNSPIDKFMGVSPIPIRIKIIPNDSGLEVVDMIMTIYWNYNKKNISKATVHDLLNITVSPNDYTGWWHSYWSLESEAIMDKTNGAFAMLQINPWDYLESMGGYAEIVSPVPIVPDFIQSYTIERKNQLHLSSTL